MARIIDICSYNGEEELFDLRYNILKDHVDQFIVVEAPTTFSGAQKPLYFERIKDKYPDVRYHVIDESWTREELQQALESPNTRGADHWKLEFLQKESIKKALTHLQDDDIVFIGDVDEIWNPEQEWNMDWLEPNEGSYANGTGKIGLKVYSYWLNNRSSEEFYGTLVGKYKYIKDECLNHLRSNPKATKCLESGWHFTSMGGAVSLRKKLTDSYTHESYATPQVLENLAYNIEQGNDFLGRDFEYTLDESEWPQYLKDNREKYRHLIK